MINGMSKNTYLDFKIKLLVIIGPSGSGKTTLVKSLVDENILEVTPSWTTRPKRSNEENTVDHIFVSKQQFKLRKNRGFFLDTAKLFGLPFEYGLPVVTHTNKSAIPVVVLRAMVLDLIKLHYSSVIIYQVESKKNLVRSRLISRCSSPVDTEHRMKLYDEEVELGRHHADRVFMNNDDIEQLKNEFIRALQQDF